MILATSLPAFGLALALALYGRQRWALGAVLAGPVMLLALWIALYAWIVLTPCEPPDTQDQCQYGLAMGTVMAAIGGLLWVGASALGWLIGWSARRISRTRQ